MGRLSHELSQEIDKAHVAPGTAMLWWLSQAGFAFKSPAGVRVIADPCLSDAAERLHGFKRLSLPPIRAEEVRADLFLLTHEHTDHLDPDAIPVIAKNNPACIFAAPEGCTEGLDTAGIPGDRRRLLAPGGKVSLRDVTIHAAGADHGSFSTSALSVALDLGGVHIMMSGDSSWRPDLFKPLYDMGLDVVIPCINGGFGNMGHIDAARMCGESGARIAIPCHFWTFAEQGAGDPLGFLNACTLFAPGVHAKLLTPGEGLSVEKKR